MINNVCIREGQTSSVQNKKEQQKKSEIKTKTSQKNKKQKASEERIGCLFHDRKILIDQQKKKKVSQTADQKCTVVIP